MDLAEVEVVIDTIFLNAERIKSSLDKAFGLDEQSQPYRYGGKMECILGHNFDSTMCNFLLKFIRRAYPRNTGPIGGLGG